MAKRAKESEPSEPEPAREAGIVKMDEPPLSADPPPEVETRPEPLAAPASPPPRVPSDAPRRVPTGPSFGERVGRFFRFLFRLVLLLIFLGLLSVALYLALPWLYDRFIRPVEQNTAQVRELQSRQEQTEQELADLQTKLDTLETVQNGHDGSLTDLDQRLNEIETEITARTQSLETLERMLSDIQAQNESTSIDLEREIKILKAMELLSRARLFMYESNFGLAKQDVQIARDLIAEVQPIAPLTLAADLDAVLLRLDMTLSNLPDFPVAASDDLDIAWQILLTGLPQPTPTQIGTETTTPIPSGSGTLTAIGTFTRTPVVTTSPAATSTPTFVGTASPSVTP
jgi:hypothetical protein